MRSMSSSSTSMPTSRRSTFRSSTRTPRPAGLRWRRAPRAPTSPPPRPGAGADPGAVVRGGRAAAGARHQPGRVPLCGRLALCRVRNGTIRDGQRIAWCRATGRSPTRPSAIYVTEALEPRQAVRESSRSRPADDDPRPRTALYGRCHDHGDEPSPSIWWDPLPLAGRRDPADPAVPDLSAGLVEIVSIRVRSPSVLELGIEGRDELHLVVLLELMRREGFDCRRPAAGADP